jgi:hypothetical protein
MFEREDYRNKGCNPKKTALDLIRSGDGFCGSEIKHGRRMAPGPKLFQREHRNKGHNTK